MQIKKLFSELKNIKSSPNLETQLEILNERLRKRTSPKHLFYFGLVQGMGYSLGATLVAGLVLFLLVQMIASIDYLPIINQFLSSDEVRETLKSFKSL